MREFYIGKEGADQYDLLWRDTTQYAPGINWVYPLVSKLCGGDKKGLDVGGSGYADGKIPIPGATIVDPRKAGSGNAYDLSMYEDEDYDFVLFSHVLEHLDDPEKAMMEAYRKLSFGGLVVCYSPHPDHIEWNPKKNPPAAAGHLWQPTSTSMGRLLIMAGYSVIYSEVNQDKFGGFLTVGKKQAP